MFSFFIYIIIAAIGAMMVYLYKQTNTTAQFLKPDPVKVRKVFYIFFAVSAIITFGLSWYTTYQLQHSSIPLEGSMQYQNIKSVMIFIINLSFVVMIVLSNAWSLSLKKPAWLAYLFTLAFYTLFILKDAYIISDYFAFWMHSVKLLKGDIPDFHSTAWVKCWMGTAVTAFNLILVWLGLRT